MTETALKITRAVQLEEIAFLQAQLASVRELLSKRTRKSDPVGHFQFRQRETSLMIELDELEGKLLPQEPVLEANCTFHCFKPSGKWYTTGRGILHDEFFKTFDKDRRRSIIYNANDGKYPGLSGKGDYYTWVIIPDESHDTGFPIMMLPIPESTTLDFPS